MRNCYKSNLFECSSDSKGNWAHNYLAGKKIAKLAGVGKEVIVCLQDEKYFKVLEVVLVSSNKFIKIQRLSI